MRRLLISLPHQGFRRLAAGTHYVDAGGEGQELGGAAVGDGGGYGAAVGRVHRDGDTGRGVGDDDTAASTADSQGGRRGIEVADAVHHNGE